MAWLYVISNRHQVVTGSLVDLAARLAGVDYLQLREKDLPAGELYNLARQIKEVLPAGTRLLVNDRLDVALAAGADGVHLGENSLPPAAARRLLGPDKILGVSVHSVEGARRAAAAGADYLLFGHIFTTASKAGLPPRGLTTLSEVAANVNIPVIALGGITVDRVTGCLAAGAGGVAVMSAVMAAREPAAAVTALRRALE
ncbi:thiamine phosphate synthase [Moorella sp. Hama-1]|uniref:thiamine phosphate synthase n=1 Tax=Moorella sp. Hama-1 TaxID=2138101 RepID=UPI000D656079|nr:thiamine phosphate synthase [Moorella sp. Hama-1]BCV20467.1 thiamine-phosphate synthase [Moorella sp. Hama-1]